MSDQKTKTTGHGNDMEAVERAKWLINAMMDEATAPELRSQITEWFESSSDWEAKGEALEEYMYSTLTSAEVPDSRTLRSKAEFMREVGIAPAAARTVTLRRRIFVRVVAAAAVLVSMAAGALLEEVLHDGLLSGGIAENVAAESEPENILVSTVAGIQKEIELEDGTKVWLNEESNVAYREHERYLEMQGKVWFDVAHDETSPFVVKTERMEILVHGTEFSVEQLEGSTVVKLIDGLLDVNLPSGKSARLYSGRQATLVWGTGELIVEPFGQTQDWRTEHVFINGKSVPEILRMTDNFYDVNIHFEAEDFTDAPEYSINLNKRQSLENVLQVLSIISNGFTFERLDDGSVRIICVK